MSEFQRRPTDDDISDAIEAAINALYGDLQSSMGITTGDFASHFDTRDKGHPATARDALRKLAFAYVDAEHAMSLQALDPMEREAVDVGTRVVFAVELDLYPHTVIHVGETGTVVAIGPDIVEVRMDEYHEGLDEWQNVVHLTDEHGAGMGDASGDNPGDAIDGLLHYTRPSDTPEPRTPDDLHHEASEVALEACRVLIKEGDYPDPAQRTIDLARRALFILGEIPAP